MNGRISGTVALLVIACCGWVLTETTGARQNSRLATPVQVSPAQGEELAAGAASVEMKWGAVAGAEQYKVEVDYKCCPGPNNSLVYCGESGGTPPRTFLARNTTSYELNLTGGPCSNQMRWRVQALTNGGRESEKSAWREFSLRSAAAAAAAAPTPANNGNEGGQSGDHSARNSQPADATAELAFWDSIKNSSDPEDYKAYLEQYPNGRFAALARRRASQTRPNTGGGTTVAGGSSSSSEASSTTNEVMRSGNAAPGGGSEANGQQGQTGDGDRTARRNSSTGEVIRDVVGDILNRNRRRNESTSGRDDAVRDNSETTARGGGGAAATPNIKGHITYIDYPSITGNPQAVLLVTQNWSPAGVYNNHATGLYYENGKWSVFNQDLSPMPAGAAFNVAPVRGFIHRATASTIQNNYTVIDDAPFTISPDATIFATPNWTPGGVYLNHPLGVYYFGGKWTIFNQDLAQMPAGAAFNVAELKGFVHRASASNTSGHVTYVDSPETNGSANATLIVTPNWNPGGAARGVYNNHSIGVYYDANRKQWAIFNQDKSAMPQGAAFNVAYVKSIIHQAVQ